jgi:PIN domain nuclease of toxin-antitoxin system
LGIGDADRQAELRSVKSAGEQRTKLLAAGIREIPLSGEIAVLAGELDGLNGDSADRIIAATAIAHDATLMTADENLLRWRHQLKRHDAER